MYGHATDESSVFRSKNRTHAGRLPCRMRAESRLQSHEDIAVVATIETVVPRKRPDRPPAGPAKKQARFELRVEEDWLQRLEHQARRFGLTVAAYIRLAASRQLEVDEASEPPSDSD